MNLIREYVVKPLTRSSGWWKVRKEHLKKYPSCFICGKKKNIHVHHIKDFSTYPELELDPDNLMSLCGKMCHRLFGHLLNWKSINEHIREDAELMHERIKNRR